MEGLLGHGLRLWQGAGDLVQDFLWDEWFVDVGSVAAFVQLPEEFLVAVAGDDHDGDRDACSLEFVDQTQAIEFRHFEIGDDQADGVTSGLLLNLFIGVLAIDRQDYVETCLAQNKIERQAGVFFIFCY